MTVSERLFYLSDIGFREEKRLMILLRIVGSKYVYLQLIYNRGIP